MDTMNKALLCGGHSKFGKVFAGYLEQHYDLTNLNRQQINTPDILDQIDDDYDFIFFNHNRGTAGFEDLTNSIEINCMLPYRIVKKQKQLRKVGWMITGDAHLSMGYPTEQYSLQEGFQCYLVVKSIHMAQQRYFSQQGLNTFVCDPGVLNNENHGVKARQLLNFSLKDTELELKTLFEKRS